MAIYERGYRPYAGAFRTRPGWWIVAREGWRVAARHRGVRWIGLIVLLMAAGACVYLFVNMGLQQVVTERLMGKERPFDEMSVELLNGAMWWFHEFSTTLVMLVGVLVGCGLIADDMRSRALTLYLVRPMSRFSYVFGKALVLPGVFLVLRLIPGLMLYLLVGMWQPPGETWNFLVENADIAGRVVGHFAIVTASLTGLMLLLSSLTSRRGVALAIGAAAVLLGAVVARIGRLLPGLAGEIGSALHPVRNAMRELRIAGADSRGWMRWLPSERGILIVTVALLVVGLVAVAWRARTTEVGE